MIKTANNYQKPPWVSKWVAALRSGKYKQGKGRLYSNGKYDCLGVLCEISGVERDGELYGAELRCLGLPQEVLDLYGIATGNGEAGITIGGRNYCFLTDANDFGATFEQIADWLDENWWQLLTEEALEQLKSPSESEGSDA